MLLPLSYLLVLLLMMGDTVFIKVWNLKLDKYQSDTMLPVREVMDTNKHHRLYIPGWTEEKIEVQKQTNKIKQ